MAHEESAFCIHEFTCICIYTCIPPLSSEVGSQSWKQCHSRVISLSVFQLQSQKKLALLAESAL